MDSKGLCDHKIVVTSILRTDEDVERLMKRNNVAVKNSAHRYATTFDVSYRNFVPVGLNLKRIGENLKRCSQKCFVTFAMKSSVMSDMKRAKAVSI